MSEYGFEEDVDFLGTHFCVPRTNSNLPEIDDFACTLDAARLTS